MSLLSDLHLKFRGAFMFHMFGWALCLSLRVTFAMHAVRSDAVAPRGSEPARVCSDRRVVYHQAFADYKDKWNEDELWPCTRHDVVSGDSGCNQRAWGFWCPAERCEGRTCCGLRSKVSADLRTDVCAAGCRARDFCCGPQEPRPPRPDPAHHRGVRRNENPLDALTSLDDYGAFYNGPVISGGGYSEVKPGESGRAALADSMEVGEALPLLGYCCSCRVHGPLPLVPDLALCRDDRRTDIPLRELAALDDHGAFYHGPEDCCLEQSGRHKSRAKRECGNCSSPRVGSDRVDPGDEVDCMQERASHGETPVMHMGGHDYLPRRRRDVDSGQQDEGRRDVESDETGFFQAPRPVTRTWEELMELFWTWFEQERQVGMAVGMVRRFVQARDDEAYSAWSTSAVGALAAGIPLSEGIELALSPEDFFVWATEVEAILFTAYRRDEGAATTRARSNVSEVEPEAETVALMERGRRGGDRQRRQDRSRSCRASGPRRRRNERASGSGEPAGGAGSVPGSGRDATDAIRAAPWRAASTSFVPPPPRDNDDCVDRWRFLLGVDTVSLPQGVETTGQDRPFLPPERAEHIRHVISGYTSTEQGLMTLGLLTALRALLAELGNLLHLASFVEVPVDEREPPPPGREPEPEADEGESDSTMWLQLELQAHEPEGLWLVQRDVNLISGMVMRFQDALSGGDTGLARLRAAHFRQRLHRLRLDENVDGAIADQFEAVCVVAEEAGCSSMALGFHALEPQIVEWSWAWWRLVEPALVLQPLDPQRPGDPVEVGSSLETGHSSGSAVATGPSEEQMIEQLAADQNETRGDDVALAAQQALFEAEEDTYYRGVEEVVSRELEAQAARAARSWDDWALHDEMYQASPRPRKRPCFEIMVSGGAGDDAQGSERRWKVPFAARGGRVVLSFGYMEMGEAAPSETSTAPVHVDPVTGAGVRQEEAAGTEHLSTTIGDGHGLEGAIPMDFPAFQELYECWVRGDVSDAAVAEQHGQATLELLQAQRIVVSSDLPGATPGDRPEGGLNHSPLEKEMMPGSTLEGVLPPTMSSSSSTGGAVGSLTGPGLESSAGLGETFLDTLLSTCRSWRTSLNGSYEDVDPGCSE